MDKYTVKMFPQAYRDIDKIYEQALLASNYADDAIVLAEKLEKAILSLEEQPYRGAERKYGFYAFKGYRQLIVENYIRWEMTPTSIGGEKQAGISGGSQSPI